jgi:hypothetical protein
MGKALCGTICIVYDLCKGNKYNEGYNAAGDTHSKKATARAEAFAGPSANRRAKEEATT